MRLGFKRESLSLKLSISLRSVATFSGLSRVEDNGETLLGDKERR